MFLFDGLFVFGQENLLQKADKEFQLKNFSRAAEMYVKWLENDKNITEKQAVLKKTGDCYNEMNYYSKAIEFFEKYLSVNSTDKEVQFKIAELYLKSGNDKLAGSIFRELFKSQSENKEIERMLACCNFAQTEKSKTDIPPIKNQSLINSGQSEFGLSFFENDLIFASSRITSDYSTIHERTNQGFSDFYSARFDTVNGMYSDPKHLVWSLNTVQNNEGTFAYNARNNIGYFTQCKRNPDLCRIFKAKWENGKWNDIKQILTGNPDYNMAHPALSSDGRLLYFASDLPGGLGGKDIWRAPVMYQGEIGTPEHLGNTVNTHLDDMFPYVIGDTILMFASEGHIGMGGLDIFYSKLKDGIFDRPVNVGIPVNSTADDFSILVNPSLNGGYFCSNRNNEDQSDDIFAFFHNLFLKDLFGKVIDSLTLEPVFDAKITYYTGDEAKRIVYTDSIGKFYIPNSAHSQCEKKHTIEIEKENYVTKKMNVPCHSDKEIIVLLDNSGKKHTIEGIVIDKKSKKPLEEAQISLSSLRGLKKKTFSDANGKYIFDGILPDDYLILRAEKKNYLNDSKPLNTPPGNENIIIGPGSGYDTRFELIPIEKYIEYRIENIYYEFDKYNLLPASKIELNKLVNILIENPQVLMRINSHTDSRGTDAYNMKLSMRRSASVVNYLTASGIKNNRLKSQGFGESQPEIRNAKTEYEHQLNRRTTFEITGENNEIILMSGKNNESVTSYLQYEDLFRLIEEALKKGIKIDESFIMDLKIKIGIGNLQKENIENNRLFNTQDKTGQAIEESPKENKEVVDENSEDGIKNDDILSSGERFSVQLISSSNEINIQKQFPQLSDLLKKHEVKVEKITNLYKYRMGSFNTRLEAEKLRNMLVGLGFKDCFIVVK